jgi:biotin-(acetyl-CoA carboxylase) ligase
MGRTLTVCVGIGINLKNEKPFPGASLLTQTEISREELLAQIFNSFEKLLPKLKDGSWREEYEDLWLHSNENVKFGGMKGIVKGVDLDGFLLVENKENGEVLTIDTDNNSFDLFEGLVHSKR